MSDRAWKIADGFQELNDELLAVARSCSPEQWARICPAERWKVAAVVCHAASAYPLQLELIRSFASNNPIPQTHPDWSAIHESNARFAVEHANAVHSDTLELLKQNVYEDRKYLAGLSDEQLDLTRYFPLMKESRTTQLMIERILLGHSEEHLKSIRAAVSRGE